MFGAVGIIVGNYTMLTTSRIESTHVFYVELILVTRVNVTTADYVSLFISSGECRL